MYIAILVLKMRIHEFSERLEVFSLEESELRLLLEDTEKFEKRFGAFEGCELNAEQLEIFSFMLPALMLGEAFPWQTLYMIREIESGIIVGNALFKGEPEGGDAEIGYEIGAMHRKLGYMGEALPLFIKIAMEHGARRLLAEVYKENTASKLLLEKAGFKLKTEDESCLYYAKTLF